MRLISNGCIFFKKRRDTNEHGDFLYPSDATLKVKEYLRNEFNKYHKREGRPLFAEKDPRNSIRLDFVYEVFPDAKFILLLRNPYGNICSLMKRHKTAREMLWKHKKENQWWRSGDGWAEQRIPGWKDLRDKSLIEASALQYAYTMQKLLKDIKIIPKNQLAVYKYEDIIENPTKFQESLYKFLTVPYLEETKSLLNTIRQPTSFPTIILSGENSIMINDICKEIFEELGYDKLHSPTDYNVGEVDAKG